jgi:phosphohistidine phosphatase
MVIGHNPGLHDLAIRVVGKGDAEAIESLAQHLTAGGLVSLSQPGEWADLGTGSARLLRYVVPRVSS